MPCTEYNMQPCVKCCCRFRKFAYLLPEAQVRQPRLTKTAQEWRTDAQSQCCVLQVNDQDILYSWVDSADWAEGIEYRLCMTPPKQPAHR